jgi:hypothetical protein
MIRFVQLLITYYNCRAWHRCSLASCCGWAGRAALLLLLHSPLQPPLPVSLALLLLAALLVVLVLCGAMFPCLG